MFKYDDFIGVPFVDGGRDARNGLDCWGLAKECFRRQGISVKDYAISAMAAAQISDAFAKNEPEWKQIEKPIPGCLVLININCGQWANHVGIYVGDGRFIHAYAYSGVAVSSVRRWKAHIVGYYIPKDSKTKVGEKAQ